MNDPFRTAWENEDCKKDINETSKRMNALVSNLKPWYKRWFSSPWSKLEIVWQSDKDPFWAIRDNHGRVWTPNFIDEKNKVLNKFYTTVPPYQVESSSLASCLGFQKLFAALNAHILSKNLLVQKNKLENTDE